MPTKDLCVAEIATSKHDQFPIAPVMRLILQSPGVSAEFDKFKCFRSVKSVGLSLTHA